MRHWQTVAEALQEGETAFLEALELYVKNIQNLTIGEYPSPS